MAGSLLSGLAHIALSGTCPLTALSRAWHLDHLWRLGLGKEWLQVYTNWPNIFGTLVRGHMGRFANSMRLNGNGHIAGHVSKFGYRGCFGSTHEILTDEVINESAIGLQLYLLSASILGVPPFDDPCFCMVGITRRKTRCATYVPAQSLYNDQKSSHCSGISSKLKYQAALGVQSHMGTITRGSF